MKGKNVLLKYVNIKNFLSLHDVSLPLKRVTIIVGPNASGKSNTLRGIELLKKMMYIENLPTNKVIQDFMWAGRADSISFELIAEVNGNFTRYYLELEPDKKKQIKAEELIINSVKVISVHNGEGEVKDEDGQNITSYSSSKLALKSAGDYGNKPITNELTEFIRNWQIYNFDPDIMRGGNAFSYIQLNRDKADELSELALGDDGSTLQDILAYWAKHNKERFKTVNYSLKRSTKLELEQKKKNGKNELFIREGYQEPIPLRKASDGTIRLLAYYILLNMSKIPSLIAIEEPERNLHPAALKEIAYVIEKLSDKTQVIITTHSSQLLDSFKSESLSNTLGVLLLKMVPGVGTKVMNLEEARKDKEALDGWISDFGIGSAIFESQLLQEIMEL